MTDLTPILKTRSRTGTFHGRTKAEEQAYFEAFGADPTPVRLPSPVAVWRQVRALLPRFRVRLR